MANANQSEEKRIYELDEVASLSPGLYVPVDQAALEMAKKFDLGTSLAGKADVTELDEVREEVESIGKPLKLIGSTTVAELNGTIEGLQPGWTYTLTDSGTLTAGDVSVDVGDEVAWSESAVWVKIGGDSCKIAVFECTYSPEAQGYVYPTYGELNAARLAGKLPVIVEISTIGLRTYYVATRMGTYMNNVTFRFANLETGAMLKLEGPTSNPVWSTGSAYDDTLSSTRTNAVQNSTLYAVIGDVETLLAAL